MLRPFAAPLPHVVLAAGLFGLLHFALAPFPPCAGEPLALRWLRAAHGHPIRTPAAVACLLLAARPPRRRPTEPERAPTEESPGTSWYDGRPM